MVRKNSGFTMVELMIVISIIGVLAVALIPTLTGAQAKARDTGRISALTNISASMVSAKESLGYFPGTQNGCLTTDAAGTLNSFYDNTSNPAAVTTMVSASFQGGKAPVDPQPAMISASVGTNYQAINCNVSKSYGYQAGKTTASAPEYSLGIFLAKLEGHEKANLTTLPTAAATNGALIQPTGVTVASTDTSRYVFKVVE